MATSDTDHEVPILEPGSYRDRAARVFYAGRRVFRGLSAEASEQWRALREADFFRRSIKLDRIVATHELTAAERTEVAADYPVPDVADEQAERSPWDDWESILEHERLPFISYPYEWSFSMLREAALLHLDLLDQALVDGFMMKDGNAFNVQWSGTRPVFLDVTSFERYRPGEAWAGYRQFCQTFLYPLMLQAYKNVAFQPWLRGRLDGLTPGEFRKLLSWRDCFRRGVLQHVVVHSLLERQVAEPSQETNQRLARTGVNQNLVRATVRHLRKTIERLQWQSESAWSNYANDNSYTQADRLRKTEFVRSAVLAVHPKRVWDLGCNTGEYSRICAETVPSVVAIDADPACIEQLFLAVRREGRKNILPLIGNLVDASPNMGWRGRERKGLAERGRPGLCLCLALLHHIVLGASVPLREVIDWLAELNCALVIEFVERNDPLTIQLLSRRPDDCPDYDRDVFEQRLRQSFEIVRDEQLPSGTRRLYFARPLTAPDAEINPSEQ